MYIRRLVIRNFRAIRHLDVTLQPGMTCLIGENNTGKTTILLALRMVLDANLPSSYRQLAREDFAKGIDLAHPEQILVAVELAGFKNRVESEALVSDWTIADDIAGICYRFRPNRAARDAIEDRTRVTGTLKIEDYEWRLAGTGGKDPATLTWKDDLGTTVRFDRLSAFHITFLQALRDVEDDLRRSRFSPLSKLLEVANLTEVQKEALLTQVRAANAEIRKDDAITQLGDSIRRSHEYRRIKPLAALNCRVSVFDPICGDKKQDPPLFPELGQFGEHACRQETAEAAMENRPSRRGPSDLDPDSGRLRLKLMAMSDKAVRVLFLFSLHGCCQIDVHDVGHVE